MPRQSEKVKTMTRDWAALVREALGEQYNKPPVIYEFTNGRQFVQPRPVYTGTNAGS